MQHSNLQYILYSTCTVKMVCHSAFIFFSGLIILKLASVNADIIFREEPSDSVVVSGLPLSFHCLVEDSENRGGVVIQWRRNNSPLQINSESRLNLFPNGSLYITATQSGDEGRYSCLASVIGTTGIVEQRTSVEAELKFAFIDPIFYSPQNITVVDQQPTPAYFQCISGDSFPVATISWEKDGKFLEEANQYASMFGGSNSMMRSGTLQIDNVRTRHAGRYRCITTNELLPGESKYSDYALLAVSPNPGQPYLNQAPTSQIVPLFDPTAFDCEILGDPKPQTTWLKDGEELTSRGDGRITIYQNGTLYFTRVEEQDEGTYMCNGSSSLGSVASEEVTLLTAYIDWNFLQEPTDLTVVEEDVATLFCRPPNSKPAVEVTWYKDNVLLSPRPGVAILDVGDLYFSAVTVADEGEYRCVATNEYVPRSVTSQTALLEVKVGALIVRPPTNKEVTLGDDLSLTCAASGDPTPTLRWLKDNVEIQAGGRITIGDSGGLLHVIDMTSLDRGTYTCMARNSYGTDQESVYINVLVDTTPPEVDTCPSIVSETVELGEQGASVTWVEPTALDISEVSQTSTSNPGDFFSIGETTVTYVFTDSSSNSDSCTFIVMVQTQDTTPPVISYCPSDQTQMIELGAASPVISWVQPTATDLSGISSVIHQSHQNGTTFPMGTTQVTYVFSDPSGNIATCSFNVKVTIGNVMMCPSSMSFVTCSPNIVVSWTTPVVQTIPGSSNLTITSSHSPGDTFTIGESEIVYNFTDQFGRTAQCIFRVSIERDLENCSPAFNTIYIIVAIGIFFAALFIIILLVICIIKCKQNKGVTNSNETNSGTLDADTKENVSLSTLSHSYYTKTEYERSIATPDSPYISNSQYEEIAQN